MTTDSQQPLYLVTAASGDTGRQVVKQLLKHKCRVRALVYRLDHRSDALKAMGVEQVMQGDMGDMSDIRAALHGVYSAYFVYPIKEGIVAATAIFAQAAEEAKVTAIVNLSQKSARHDSQSHAALNHWLAERVFDKFSVPVTHLRPTLFAEWFLYMAPLIALRGRMEMPTRTSKHAPISAQDQALVIAAIMRDPVKHAGKTYELYGPTEYTWAEMCDILSDVVGYKVSFSVGSKRALETVIRSSIDDDYLIQHLMALMADYESGLMSGTNNLVTEITGVKQQSLREWFVQHKAAFDWKRYVISSKSFSYMCSALGLPIPSFKVKRTTTT